MWEEIAEKQLNVDKNSLAEENSVPKRAYLVGNFPQDTTEPVLSPYGVGKCVKIGFIKFAPTSYF